MPPTNIDWSFDDAPSDAEPAHYGLSLGPRGTQTPRPRWLAPSLLLLVGVAAGAVGIYLGLGWSRIKSQIAAEVSYEDTHARRGDVALVESVQAQSDPAWLARRAGETQLGLAAPLPALNLVPAPIPARVLTVLALGGDQFEAEVARRYDDSAGRAYDFVLPQRYRNLAPGQWVRLPPDTGALLAATTFYSQNLTVRLPVADVPWLSGPLQQADQALEQACADWAGACSAHQPIRLMFAGQLDTQPAPEAPRLGAAAGLGPYPLAFDLPGAPSLQPLRFVAQMVLASPHLAGLPRDAAASQILGNAIAVQALDYLASRVTSGTLSQGDLFRQALVAREEVRLGLTVPGRSFERPYVGGRSTVVPGSRTGNERPSATTRDFVPPARLWNASTPDDPVQQLSHRVQALAFLNYALNNAPSAADGLLLNSLASRPDSLTHWLDSVLNGSAGFVINQWNTGQFSAPGEPAPAFDGLAYTCSNEVWMVRGGRPEHLFTGPDWVTVSPDALSPDGRYLALSTGYNGEGRSVLGVFDTLEGRFVTVDSGFDFVPLGWSDKGQLLYLKPIGPSSAEGVVFSDYALWRFQPGAGSPPAGVQSYVSLNWPGTTHWSADHTWLGLTLKTMPGDQLAPAFMASDTLGGGDAPGAPRLLAQAGWGPVISPDGRRAVYSSNQADAAGGAPGLRLAAVDLASGARQVLATAASLPGAGSRLDVLGPLNWSPDGQWLALLVGGSNRYNAQVYVMPSGGGIPQPAQTALPDNWVANTIGFSGDSQYLAYTTHGSPDSIVRLEVIALAAGQAKSVALVDLPSDISAAWSPRGHQLAVAGPDGVYVLDPGMGATHWVAGGDCRGVAWYAK